VDDHYVILTLAIILDVCTGDPQLLYRHIPHPVVVVGRCIAALERVLSPVGGTSNAQILRGVALAVTVIFGFTVPAVFAAELFGQFSFGWLIEAAAVSTLLAGRGLWDHVRDVAVALAGSLDDGREAVGRIVGRDPNSLDRAGVARAAIESAAENFGDGFVAPVFWYAIAGLPGIVAYKCINTLDSMIGHHNDHYEYFGKVAARIDDVANWLPARLTGIIVCLAAFTLRDASALAAFNTMRRDAPKHRSPNAGWCEAAFAGALNLALAGPRQYANATVEDAWMGDGRSTLDEADINAALRLYVSAWAICGGVVILLALVALSG
jgi:adenosylcobinamide-phosphate synthase